MKPPLALAKILDVKSLFISKNLRNTNNTNINNIKKDRKNMIVYFNKVQALLGTTKYIK
jgi:hypothetical protein